MSKYSKFLVSPWLALLTFALLLTVKISDPFMVESVRLKFYDYLMLDEPVQSEQIVIASIGEKTLEKYGQYPFPRDIYAQINSDLYNAGAGLVGTTILYPEPDRFGHDTTLQQSLSSYPVVLSQTLSTDCSKSSSGLKRTGVAVVGDGKSTSFLPNYPCVLSNIPELQNQAPGVGVTSTLPEPDGVVRRVPLLGLSENEYYPAFALEMLRVAAGDPSYQAKINETGVEALRVPQFDTIKTDEYGRVFINPNYKFESFEIGAQDTPDLTDKIVILGVTAAGVSNPVATPSGAQYPHQVQASLLETLLNGDSVSIPNWAGLVDLGSFFVLVVGMIILSRVRFSVLYIGILLGAYLYLPVFLFAEKKILLDVTFNVIAVALIYMHIYTAKFISEFLQKQQIKKQFGTYLSKQLVEKLQKNPELLQLGGETKRMTFMFSDIRGFTPISEQYKTDPQGLTKLINRFLTPMTNTILDHEGTIDKYMGDCIMAFWNAPLEIENHETKAIKCAIAMDKALKGLNDELTRDGLLPIHIGIGVNSGDCVVGNMGSDTRFDYSVLGDPVNLASRLEGQSKGYGVTLIIGEESYKGASKEIKLHLVELDLIAVKGKVDPVRIYTYVSKTSPKFFMEHDMFRGLYNRGNFAAAISVAERIKDTNFDGSLSKYYELMIERMRDLEMNDPTGIGHWDGVYRATSK